MLMQQPQQRPAVRLMYLRGGAALEGIHGKHVIQNFQKVISSGSKNLLQWLLGVRSEGDEVW